ncbi:PIG-P domain-containing protein [Strongyloides ratti]|uniref:PIG-P domain-containing protein n=1 Tax=Strongyloides ratti TaxID=34506 RepID=A0A090KXZ5_STRRB|nr:PIG-P domain-containing protein [Strongyloides ratti]CEF62286.1 PIG-P domain-containing protein [Strongyloides ratti]
MVFQCLQICIPYKSTFKLASMTDTSLQDLSFKEINSIHLKEFEETPLPDAHRAIYGFAFYILNWVGFLIYLFWVLTPYSYLEYLNLTFFPSKYYGLCLPLLIPFGITLYLSGVFLYNFIKFQDIDDKEVYLEDDFSGMNWGNF